VKQVRDAVAEMERAMEDVRRALSARQHEGELRGQTSGRFDELRHAVVTWLSEKEEQTEAFEPVAVDTQLLGTQTEQLQVRHIFSTLTLVVYSDRQSNFPQDISFLAFFFFPLSSFCPLSFSFILSFCLSSPISFYFPWKGLGEYGMLPVLRQLGVAFTVSSCYLTVIVSHFCWQFLCHYCMVISDDELYLLCHTGLSAIAEICMVV